MQSLQNLLQLLYDATPDSLQFIYRPGQIFMRNLHNIRIELWMLSGLELNTKKELTILYASNEMKKTNMNYFIKLAFGDYYKVDHIGKAWLFQTPKLAKQKYSSSMLVVEVPNFVLFNMKNCFRIPSWVRGEIDISVDIKSLMLKTESLESAQRRIKKNALTFEKTNDISRLSDFYYHMYLPYINKRFGNAALIENYQTLNKKFPSCDLILIKLKDEEIAGSLIAYKGHKVRLWVFGIKDANEDYVKKGAFGALYYFSFQYLKEKGFKKVGVGGSRPFLNDGVLNYKKKWGLRITEPHELIFVLKQLKMTAGSRSFLANNPFIYMDKNKFNSAVFLDENVASEENTPKVIATKYNYAGISNIVTRLLNSTPNE